jgi:hypothetical protein
MPPQRIVCEEHIIGEVVKRLNHESLCGVCGSPARLVIDLSKPPTAEDAKLRLRSRLLLQ